jgi:matrixin
MKMTIRRTTILLAALLMLAATALTATITRHATLIDVHETSAARNPAKGGSSAANCVDDDPSRYSTTGPTYTGWKSSPTTTTAHLNVPTVPSSLGSVTATLQAAFDAWSGAPGINVATDGTVTRYTANRQDDLLWGRTGSSIATTYTWRWNDGLVESDVVFNKSYAWFLAEDDGTGCLEGAGARFDVGNIATHEFGHVYGLDHPAGARFESMYAYGYTGETLKRTPTPGELNGIGALYS